MESTVVPLELYFEHRNYLPAVGLYLALLAFARWLWGRRPWLAAWFFALWSALLANSVIATGIEVQLWSSNQLFHFAAVNRHPLSVRANGGMARVLAASGDIEAALQYSAKVTALDGRDRFRHRLRDALLYCRAQSAIPSELFLSWSMSPADFRDDHATESAYILVKQLIGEACEKTDLVSLADHWGGLLAVVDEKQVTPKLYLSLAILENHIERYDEALAHVDALLRRTPGDKRALMMRLYFTVALQLDEERERTLQELRVLEREGMLNQQDRYNLSLLAGEGVE